MTGTVKLTTPWKYIIIYQKYLLSHDCSKAFEEVYHEKYQKYHFRASGWVVPLPDSPKDNRIRRSRQCLLHPAPIIKKRSDGTVIVLFHKNA